MTQVAARNLLILGDLAVPPRSLLKTFQERPVSGIPRFDGEAVQIIVNGKHVELNLWDEEPDVEYIGPRRRLLPTKVHIILISFGIDSPDSLGSVKEQWIRQVLTLYPRVPILLVGCNKELRNGPGLKASLQSIMQMPVGPKQGEEAAKDIQATIWNVLNRLVRG